jgi:hypothetical protein
MNSLIKQPIKYYDYCIGSKLFKKIEKTHFANESFFWLKSEIINWSTSLHFEFEYFIGSRSAGVREQGVFGVIVDCQKLRRN